MTGKVVFDIQPDHTYVRSLLTRQRQLTALENISAASLKLQDYRFRKSTAMQYQVTSVISGRSMSSVDTILQ